MWIILLGVAALLGAVPSLASSPPKGKNEPRPRNVLLIVIDTLRADHVSCYGYHLDTTPHIDRLAGEGTKFNRAYTVIPLTGPAHFSLFTSKFPQEHGARRNGVAMAKGTPHLSFAQILKRHGYRNAAFISGWPLTSRLTHLDRWFHHYDQDLPRKYQLFNSSRYAEDVTPRAIKWLKGRANKKRPFFLWVHYFDPHSPYNFREHFAYRKQNGNLPAEMPWKDDEILERIRDYDSEVAYADHHVGLLLKTLDEEVGMRESTLVILAADHGESLGEHDYVGHGRHLYENIIRIPLIFRFPGKVPAAKVIDTPVSILDIAPTVLDLTVKELPRYKKPPLLFAGRSLIPAFADGDQLPERRIHYVTYPGKKGFAPTWLSWLWIDEEELPLRFGRLDGHHKTIWSPSDNSLEVYDLSKDPVEARPLALNSDASGYHAETASLKRWYSATEAREGEERLSKRDMEMLRSLGYVQ